MRKSIIKKWTKETIIERLRELHEQGISLKLNNLRKNYNSLLQAIDRNFSSCLEAIKEAGIELDYDIYSLTLWTDEMIAQELKRIEANGEPLNSKYMEKNHRKVWDAGFNHFGNWKNTIEHVFGYDYEEQVLGYTRWSKEKLIDELLKIKENGEPLNVVYMIAHHYNIVDMAYNHFNNYEELVVAAGLNYDEIRLDYDTDKYFGVKFENIVREMYDFLGYKYKYHEKYDDCIPDFSESENGLWIDAKLSAWTLSISTKEKRLRDYMKKCNKLIIVYLRGKPAPSLKKYSKLEFRLIDTYYPLLRQYGKTDFIKEFTKLKSEVKKYERSHLSYLNPNPVVNFPKVNLLGKRFNKLLVTEFIERRNGEPYWKCICDCGNEHMVRGTALTRGHVSSCGCLRKEMNLNKNMELIGVRFGRLIVADYMGVIGRCSHFKCICDCGNEIIVPRSRLLGKVTQSCGCLQRDRARECNLGNKHGKNN